MKVLHKLVLWLFLALFGLNSLALADKNKNQKEIDARRAKRLAELRIEWELAGKTHGSCQTGIAFSDLDANNVRARLYNTGGLFWKGAGAAYNVPKEGGGNSIFASGIWIGGMVDGELRMVASDYGPWELWPGPLDDDGKAPADCGEYDRMYKVARQDILDFEHSGIASADLGEWPFDLGAPVIDGDGDPNNYNLAAGDRPEIIGDQGIWWIMNDMGNEHSWSLTQPIGLEVQVLAFSFKRADALNNMTFYKYRLINKGKSDLTETYFGIWVDPDLGDAGDDYVGSDTTRGMGFVWNGDNFDGGADGYGDKPPALGYDFFKGPVEVDSVNVGATQFLYYNGDSTVQGNPDSGDDAYKYLKGLWRDNSRITLGGTGRGFSETPVDFMFPGNPPEFWSEEDTDNAGSRNTPADRRFLMSTGPFTLEPGGDIDVVYGIVWSQSTDRFKSVYQMKSDDALAQAAFNVNFELPAPPDPPRIEVSEMDETVTIMWGYRPSDNNYLDTYDVPNPFLEDVEVDDKTLSFEGYNIYHFASQNDLVGERVATFDLVNGVQGVTDLIDATRDPPTATFTAFGTDSGIQHSYQLNKQANYTDTYWGVQAYAYNKHSSPKVFKGAISRVAVRASKNVASNGGSIVDLDNMGVDIPGESVGSPSDGTAGAVILDAAGITGDTYLVKFFGYEDNSDPENPVAFTTYDIINDNTGRVIVDGRAVAESQGLPLKLGPNVGMGEGLEFSVFGPDEDFSSFLAVANGAGPIEPPTGAAADFQDFPVPERPGEDQQVGDGRWFFHTADNGDRGHYSAFLDRTTRSGANWPKILPNDYEMRFTYDDDNFGFHAFTDCSGLVPVPFELWDIGVATPEDPSDDHRMFPFILDDDGGCEYALLHRDHTASGGENDPYTDWTYWYDVADESPGEGGYQAQLAEFQAGGDDNTTDEEMVRTVLINWNGGDVTTRGPYDQAMPERGTIIRIITNKVNTHGTIFQINTASYAPVKDDLETAESALDLIQIVPNPYKGVSDYELSNLKDVARFTNMPERATIRVFTLSGALIKTINKSGPETSIDWDLLTEQGLPVASGMYLIHVDVPNVGEKVIKFGVVKKRIQLDLL